MNFVKRLAFMDEKLLELTEMTVFAGPASGADADSFLTAAVAGAVSHDALRLPDVALRPLPAVHAVALASTVDPMAAAEQRAHT